MNLRNYMYKETGQKAFSNLLSPKVNNNTESNKVSASSAKIAYQNEMMVVISLVSN